MSPTRRRKPAARRAPRRKAMSSRDFWGTDEVEDDRETVITPTDHPTALIESLGPPPFRSALAKHYFDAVYERAAALAVALAASAGLTDLSDPEPD